MAVSIEALFISDVHLGSKGSHPDELLDVLKNYKPKFLFIIGDFIDGWLLKRRHHWPQHYTNLIRKILSYSKEGTHVVYVTGNHDDFLRNYTPLKIGNIDIVDEYEWNDYLITHGDLYDGVVQLKWLGVLGSWGYELAIWIDKMLKRIGYRRSFSKMLKNRVKAAVKFITRFEEQLCYQAERKELKGVVCGHIHTPCDKKIEQHGQTFHYLNCGDWIENLSFIVYNKGQFSLSFYKKSKLKWKE